jgi:hypothetical protein
LFLEDVLKNMKPSLTADEKLKLEIELSRRAKALADFKKTGHGTPRTRREFLGSGLLAGAAFMTAPTLLQILASEASAAGLSSECKALLEPTPGMIPFIQINLTGGASLGSQLMALDKNRQPLTDYSLHGLGKAGGFQTTAAFGNQLLPSMNGVLVGKVMEGLLAKAGTTAAANTALIPFFVRSQDDNPSNPYDITGLVNAIGVKGTLLPNLGSTGSPRVHSLPTYVASTAPQIVKSVQSVRDALAPGGTLKTALKDPAQQSALLNLLNKLSSGQRKNLERSPSGLVIGKLAECSTGKNIDLQSMDPNALDPRMNADVAAAWGIAKAGATDTSALQATAAFNTINGNAGSSIIEIGGFDYHGQTRTQSDATDLGGGQLIGNVLRTAEILGKPVFIHVVTDGAVSSADTIVGGAWRGDAGTLGSGYMIAYNPKGRPLTSDSQLGAYNSEAAVDESWIENWTVDRCALAVFANYLQLHGKVAQLDSLVPNQFDPSALKKIIKFA